MPKALQNSYISCLSIKSMTCKISRITSRILFSKSL
nr:MAG TPA: hypothetical protein [Caudoviricetes sp.]